MGNKYEGLDAFAVRLIKHKARQLVGSAGFVEGDRHDLEQEMVIDLLLRLPRFDPRLSKRETFIARVVEHRVATLVESQRAGVRDHRRRVGSLDERRTDVDGDEDDIPPVLNDRHFARATVAAAELAADLRALRMDMDKLIAELPVDLRALCVRLAGATVSEVARETGVPRGTLYEAIRKLRTRFERAGLAAYLEGSDTSRKPPVGNR